MSIFTHLHLWGTDMLPHLRSTSTPNGVATALFFSSISTTCQQHYPTLITSTAPPAMSKGTRFVTVAVPAAFVYLLMLFAILPVPFVARDTADLILPVVSSD